jgi:bisphosphoglycerate-dependent phosphoglycerate mutase
VCAHRNKLRKLCGVILELSTADYRSLHLLESLTIVVEAH